MKKILSLIVIISLVFSLTSRSVYADSALKKLGRGLCNIGTCPLEVLKRIADANEESGFIAGFTWGLLDGVWRTFVRGGVGVYEVVTFPIPLPEYYEPIITDPEFFFGE